MGQPAARVTDMHTCPMVTPGTPPVPHVGGPILPTCSPNVITGGLPQARVTDKAYCVGPPDVIVKGSMTVLVNNLPAARIGDQTVHGGVIVTGMPTVLIGDAGGGSAGTLGSSSVATISVGGGQGAMGSPSAEAKVAASDTSSASEKSGDGGDKSETPPQKAQREILEKFGSLIPDSRRSPSGSEVTEYLDDTEFKKKLKEKWPKQYKTDDDLKGINGVQGGGKIYINKDKANKWTPTHEQLHHYSDQKFRNDFREINGVKFNEGATEFFTRKISNEKRPGIYVAETALVEKMIKDNKFTEEELQNAYFKGDETAMKKIKEALSSS